MSFIQLTITALVVCAALGLIMALAWLVQQKSGNAGWVDVSWSFGVGAVAFVAALLPLHRQWPQWRQIYRLHSSLHPGVCDLAFTSLDELAPPRMTRDIAT